MRRPDHVEANVRYATGPAFTLDAMKRVEAHAWDRNFYD
jgi:hypothetical protein